MSDELNDRRQQKRAVNASQEMSEALRSQEEFVAFQQWIVNNLPYDHLGCHANGMAGSIAGAVIGTWFDAGASPEVLKEYFSKFIDFLWSQYKHAQISGGG